MSPLEYLPTIVENLSSLLFLMFFLAYPYWKLIRSVSISIYDPIFLILFGDWMGTTLAFFMWSMNDISDSNFYYYCFSQFSFICGLLIVRKNQNKSVISTNEVRQITLPFIILVNSAVVHILSTLSIWSIAGIPIFSVSRIGTFIGSGGFGIIERLQSGSMLIATFSACYIFGEANGTFRKRISLLYFFWLLVSSALSGSKAAYLFIIEIIFVYIYIFKRDQLGNQSFYGGKKGVAVLIGATAFALLVISIQSQEDLIGILSAFAFRIISFGDIYMYAYLEDTITQIKGNNPMIGMFGGILSTFRLLPLDMTYLHMGLQFTSIIFPNLDYFAGPNPRHSVFGYHYFGWAGILYSFFLGVFVVSLQKLLFHTKKTSYLRVLFFFLLYFSLVSVASDFDYSMAALASSLISGIPILFASLIIFYSSYEKRKQIQN